MAETKQEKTSVVPGLVKSGYEKPKKRTINPTMQAAVEELPTAEKSVMFREYYANTLSHANWMPVDGEIPVNIEYDVKVVSEVKPVVSENKYEKTLKPRKEAKEDVKHSAIEEKFVVPEIKPLPQQVPSDMEIAMNMAPIPEVKTKQPEFDTLNMNVGEVPETTVENISKTNVFETINSMQANAEQPAEKKPATDRDALMSAKPFMKIDKVEIRSVENASGEVVYMIGKQICTSESYESYLQEVAGKILAMDCKRIEIKDVIYTKQSDGSFKDSNNNTISMDQMLTLLHE